VFCYKGRYALPVNTARIYGPYVRPVHTDAFLTPVHTARTYGPYVLVVRIGLNMEPRLKCFSMVTNGGGSGLKFFEIILFQHGTTSEMK